MMIQIKAATSADLSEIAVLQANALLVDDYAPLKPEIMNLFINEMRKRWEKLINQNSDILVMKDTDETIGFAVYSLQGEDIEIKNIYINVGKRRAGHGTKLYTAILEHSSNTNYEFVTTWIAEENTLLKSFYTKLGFRATTNARVDLLREDMELREVLYQTKASQR